MSGPISGLIAVTGAEGFIGSHLVEALLARGEHVRAMVQYNAFGSWGHLDSLSATQREHLEVVLGDVRDPNSTRAFLEGVQTVYHLAALIAIPYSYRAPRSYIETNVLGTLNVLEAARDLKLERVIHTSTSEVYGTAQFTPMNENHPLQTQSPYAASKSAADHLASSFHLSFGLPVVTLRPFNTFGPRQSARAVIPTVIAQLASGQTDVRLGALDPTRDFLFVRDTVSAFIAVGTAPIENLAGHVLNAGTGVETSIQALVQLIAQVMNRPVNVLPDPERLRPSDSEVMRLMCDASRLRELTGWQPQYTLEEGLRITAEWFSDPDNLARMKADIYNV